MSLLEYYAGQAQANTKWRHFTIEERAKDCFDQAGAMGKEAEKRRIK